MFVPNEQQEEASDAALTWHRAFKRGDNVRPWFEISGPAGSGKTTLVKYIIQKLGIRDQAVVFVTFTGKAALALRLSGVPGRTIHSICYQTTIVNERDEKGNIVYVNGKPKLKRIQKKVEKLDPSIELMVADEAGMIGTEMGLDLLSFGIPVIALGDLHQLPPVFGNGLFLHQPDAILTKIMRQVEGNPIIYLSQLAIYKQPIQYGTYGANNEATVISKHAFLNSHELATKWLSWADMIICGTNYMRDQLNQYVRTRIQKITEPYVQPSDKLICRQNHWDILLDKPYDDIALVNGLVGYCTTVYKDTHSKNAYVEIDFRPEFSSGQEFDSLPINHQYLFAPYSERKQMNVLNTDIVPFEFGNAITCHLSQGSQAKKVVVFVEDWSSSDYFWKWLYTAITRASSELCLII